jgi:bifunctional DNA-binding transcriptional regulator/antitoxin component of YhaV-PrlF toxin-antitoxin module
MAQTTHHSVRLGPQGRLVVPLELLRELDLDEGSELAIRSDGHRLILEPRSEILHRLRCRFADVADVAEVSIADELAADRQEETHRDSKTR